MKNAIFFTPKIAYKKPSFLPSETTPKNTCKLLAQLPILASATAITEHRL